MRILLLFFLALLVNNGYSQKGKTKYISTKIILSYKIETDNVFYDDTTNITIDTINKAISIYFFKGKMEVPFSYSGKKTQTNNGLINVVFTLNKNDWGVTEMVTQDDPKSGLFFIVPFYDERGKMFIYGPLKKL